VKFLRSVWEAIKTLIAVSAPALIAKEPAISAGVGSLAVSIGAHYGLHLTAIQETYVAGGALFLLNLIVRQVVTPTSSTALKSLGDVKPESVTVRTAQRKVSKPVKAAPRKRSTPKRK